MSALPLPPPSTAPGALPSNVIPFPSGGVGGVGGSAPLPPSGASGGGNVISFPGAGAGVPSAPVPAPAAGAAAAAGASSIWTATPASAGAAATAATAAVGLGIGLGLGNEFYEAAGRPWGESLGDHYQRMRGNPDGPSISYPSPGDPKDQRGQVPGVLYYFGYTTSGVNMFGNEFNIQLNPRQFGPAPGPISVQLQEGENNRLTYVAVDGNGDLYGLVGNVQNLQSITKPELFFERVDGEEDPAPTPGPPQTQPMSEPRQNPYPATQPQTSPSPQGQPRTSPIAPPQIQPGSDPYPFSFPTPQPATSPGTAPFNPFDPPRPAPGDFPDAFPPLVPLPARAPQPTTTPVTPTPPQSAPQPSTRQQPNCGCNAGVLAGVGSLLNPLRSGQAATAASLSAEAASTATILDNIAKTQRFLETAWESTRLTKLINYLTLVSVIHNSAMLSSNVGQTLGDLTSNMLATIGIKDEGGSPLDINELVGSSVESFTRSIVGDAIYDNVSVAWQKANRIISSASMIVYTVRSINDTSKDVLEWSAENLGKIGNALKRYGVVGERSYPWMSERVKAQDKYRRNFQRVTDGLEQLEDTASSLNEVTSNVRDIQEEYADLKQQQDDFRVLIEETLPSDTVTSAPENQPIAADEVEKAADSESSDVAIADAQKSSS